MLVQPAVPADKNNKRSRHGRCSFARRETPLQIDVLRRRNRKERGAVLREREGWQPPEQASWVCAYLKGLVNHLNTADLVQCRDKLGPCCFFLDVCFDREPVHRNSENQCIRSFLCEPLRAAPDQVLKITFGRSESFAAVRACAKSASVYFSEGKCALFEPAARDHCV